jgi:hypothetical protein
LPDGSRLFGRDLTILWRIFLLTDQGSGRNPLRGSCPHLYNPLRSLRESSPSGHGDLSLSTNGLFGQAQATRHEEALTPNPGVTRIPTRGRTDGACEQAPVSLAYPKSVHAAPVRSRGPRMDRVSFKTGKVKTNS